MDKEAKKEIDKIDRNAEKEEKNLDGIITVATKLKEQKRHLSEVEKKIIESHLDNDSAVREKLFNTRKNIKKVTHKVEDIVGGGVETLSEKQKDIISKALPTTKERTNKAGIEPKGIFSSIKNRIPFFGSKNRRGKQDFDKDHKSRGYATEPPYSGGRETFTLKQMDDPNLDLTDASTVEGIIRAAISSVADKTTKDKAKELLEKVDKKLFEKMCNTVTLPRFGGYRENLQELKNEILGNEDVKTNTNSSGRFHKGSTTSNSGKMDWSEHGIDGVGQKSPKGPGGIDNIPFGGKTGKSRLFEKLFRTETKKDCSEIVERLRNGERNFEEKDIDCLIKALKDKDVIVRQNAALWFNINTEYDLKEKIIHVIPYLINAFEDNDPKVRESIASTFERICRSLHYDYDSDLIPLLKPLCYRFNPKIENHRVVRIHISYAFLYMMRRDWEGKFLSQLTIAFHPLMNAALEDENEVIRNNSKEALEDL
ncbi:MAG: hypothetical protein KAQ92_00800, partial [Candidatus Aenigmarchaeota archaeon]|nr:hypothetical protein [Candidatus Aenigmarchaeota archaeon]